MLVYNLHHMKDMAWVWYQIVLRANLHLSFKFDYNGFNNPRRIMIYDPTTHTLDEHNAMLAAPTIILLKF